MPDFSEAALVELMNEYRADLNAAGDQADIESLRVAAFGKKGRLTALMKALLTLPAAERPIIGARLNRFKDDLAAILAERNAALAAVARRDRTAAEIIDVTLPIAPLPHRLGSLHPVPQVIEQVTAIFADLGFDMAEGPDIETDYYNFTALNIPPEHPARQSQDTFYLDAEADGMKLLLRTHTSPVQIRTMLTSRPPIRLIAPGRTYRRDSDPTHTPMFHQLEGLVVDENVHLGHLKWTLQTFIEAFFEVEIAPMRFRSAYFPFTEPSLEVDIRCRRTPGRLHLGEGDEWLEILGCGMVHPAVLAGVGIDPRRYRGFAFGIGLDRIAMLKYGMADLRDFFAGDLDWLRHYGFGGYDDAARQGGAGR